MWVDNPPSGRERAIETLIDMEPHGPFYRAARVLVSAKLAYYEVGVDFYAGMACRGIPSVNVYSLCQQHVCFLTLNW